MILTPSESKQWITTFKSLLLFVNQKTGVFPEVNTIESLSSLGASEGQMLHDKLYDDLTLVDQYLQANPDNLDQEALSLITGIKKLVRGIFYIERCLKNYSVFVSENDKVYAVLGITDPLNQIIPNNVLPLMVKTTLLPFKGRIIYDGLLQTTPIFFGSNIKRELKETYMAAKQKGKIIETLEKTAIARKPKVTQPNWQPILQDLQKSADKLRSIQTSPALHQPTFALVKASIQLLESVVSNPENYQEAEKSLSKITRAMKQVERVIDRQSY